MDWPQVVDPILRIPDDDMQFRYDCPSDVFSAVLRSYGEEKGRIILKDDGDWDEWFQDQVFQENLMQTSSTAMKDHSGYHILLCGSPMPQSVASEKFPSRLWYLPFSLARWQQITRSFHLHVEINNAMLKSEDGGRATYFVHDSLRMYTAAMSWGEPRWSHTTSLAISSTYFEKFNLTVAVIFGCSNDQMKRVEQLLAMSPEVKSHPLLTVGIFAELEKDRMRDIVGSSVAACDIAISKLGLDSDSPPVAKRDFIFNKALRDARIMTKMAEEEVRTTKGLLQNMIARVEEEQQLRNSQDDANFAASTRRFKQRFAELDIEFDTMMARCRMTFDDMTYSEDLYMTEIISRDAERARDQAKVSTVIAFVAMLYLPITTVATIFAMPVFDFANDWRDIYFRKTDADKPPVLSSYFWVYLIVSITLTGFTVFGWWRYTKSTSTAQKRKNALRQRRPSSPVTTGKDKGGRWFQSYWFDDGTKGWV
ncbi:hypothetical protein B0T21DRAFT_378826 [Apiosordaria backusii]|uniref:Uncharacterized protein n=1 Tax=Apiosordaria backusii TaxID=314023 RepID=A0AA40DHG3_9PEZI|nr:hypothetical protein B0T21DRAFT_378826 [Apiosordaria backusii]